MDIDFEPITLIKNSDKSSPDDLNEFLIDCSKSINYKIAFLIFLAYIILNTDVFIENILSKFNNTSINNEITNKGIVISGLILSLTYILLDVLDKNSYM